MKQAHFLVYSISHASSSATMLGMILAGVHTGDHYSSSKGEKDRRLKPFRHIEDRDLFPALTYINPFSMSPTCYIAEISLKAAHTTL